MFIWDFAVEAVLSQIIDWIYSQIVGFLGDFLMQMGNMRADLFAMGWVQSIVLFFSYLAWALYITEPVVAVFECGIDYQVGRSSVKKAALNAIGDFLAVSLSTTAPVELYKLYVSLQGSFTAGITGLGDDFGTVAAGIANFLKDAGTWEAAATSKVFGGLTSVTSLVLVMFVLILMGYAIIEMFFASLKRGGILPIQIAASNLYMFSVPRGCIGGFVSWSKQVISLYLTAFLQTTVLVTGLMVVRDRALLRLRLILSTGGIPRIAGQFSLDTTTRANVTGAVYAAQGAVNLAGTTVQAVAKQEGW